MVELNLPPLKKPVLWHPGFLARDFRQPEPADLKGTLLSLSPVAKDHIYQREFGLFCRLEKSVNAKIHFPVKLRLGEVQYVERMEGKQ